MSINIKKYTKEQMAKMVEEVAERLKSQEKENEKLDEQLKSQTAKTIALRNDLMAKMHSNATLTRQISQMNGESITRENVIADLKADADALRNKLADTEAALGRANACIATMKVERDQQTKDLFAWRKSAQNLHDDLLNARERAHYAEAHPWKTLWTWLKRKLKMA